MSIESTELLRQLREEVRDWQDALSGERPDLDQLCSRIDAHLIAAAADGETGANVGKVQIGAAFITEAGFILLDGEDGEGDELSAALALVPASSWGVDSVGFHADDVTAAFVRRDGPESQPSEVWVTDARTSLAGRDSQEFACVYHGDR